MLHADRNANGIIINMLQVKCRLGAIGHVIALDTGIVRTIQYDNRRRQRGINSEVERPGHRIACVISRFHR
nr:hypothetical protein [Salmonella enterica]